MNNIYCDETKLIVICFAINRDEMWVSFLSDVDDRVDVVSTRLVAAGCKLEIDTNRIVLAVLGSYE